MAGHRDSLDDFLTPITTGLLPAERFTLSRERARELDRRLRELLESRQRAAVASRTYWLT